WIRIGQLGLVMVHISSKYTQCNVVEIQNALQLGQCAPTLRSNSSVLGATFIDQSHNFFDKLAATFRWRFDFISKMGIFREVNSEEHQSGRTWPFLGNALSGFQHVRKQNPFEPEVCRLGPSESLGSRSAVSGHR